MNYKEYLVKRRLGAAEMLLTVLLYFAAFMLALCCLYYLRGTYSLIQIEKRI